MKIDVSNELNFKASDFVGRSIAVLGITGSGKTNTAAVLMEEMLAANFPLSVIDIEGEYWGLKERFEILIAGKGEHTDLTVEVGQATALAHLSIERGLSLILDVSDFDETERFDFVLEYLTALWEANLKVRRPYAIFIEEAHEFIPQSLSTPLKATVKKLASRGRKRGFSVIMMTQRTQKIDKDVLTQADLYFLHRVAHPLDLKTYKDIIPLESKEVAQIVPTLQPGEAIVLYQHVPKKVHIRPRYTFHVGATPELDAETAPELKKIDAALLKELSKLVTAPKPDAQPTDEVAKLKVKVKALEIELFSSQAETARLKEQLEIVSRLKLSVEGLPVNAPLINPKTLEIDKAVVNQLVAVNHHSPNEFLPSAPTVDTTQPKEPPATPSLPVPTNNKLRQDLMPVEKARLKRTLDHIAKLQPPKKAIFSALLNNPTNNFMDKYDLAMATGYAETTVSQNYPHVLERARLITYIKRGNSYFYKSNAYNFAIEAFPGVEPETIIREIKAVL